MTDNTQMSDVRTRESTLPGGSPAPEMNPDDYMADLEGFDLTETQKVELLRALWDIMRRFVEMDIDVGAADPCGQIFAIEKDHENSISDDVQSSFLRATEMETINKQED